jgi:hypothetical protein
MKRVTRHILGGMAALSFSLGTAWGAAPTASSTRIEREIITHRATQAVYWGMPAVALVALRRGAERDLGARDNDIICFSQPMEARHGFITANNQTPYCAIMIDTHEGPVVMEVPPAGAKTVFFGTAVDAWQVPLADVGPRGDDRGRGGKFLFVPPGYDKPLPEGYIVVRSQTYRIYLGLRPVAINGGTVADGVAYSRQLKAYPLAQADHPPANRFIDPFPKIWNTLPAYDLTFFRDLADVVRNEPTQPKDITIVGMLASLGIEKGKPFAPDAAMQKTLTAAARLGYDMLQSDFVTPGRATRPYWPNSRWLEWMVSDDEMAQGFPFMEDGKMLFERRGDFFHWVTFPVKAFAKPRPTYYLIAQRDQADRLFDGKSQYRLHVPPEVPASQFWSAIVYSMNTKGFIGNASRVGISSYDKTALKTNDDGSVDLYFGGKAPKGKESNWLPTGEPFFVMFRYYGPQPAFWDKSWTMPDVEKVK